MTDPYKVLEISQNATDDDIKRAYRELARKYHPDNYINNPLADLASEKMKEINEAYDMIMSSRSPHQGGYDFKKQDGNGNARNPVYTQIRNAITVNNIDLAEEMLRKVAVHDAEWHFLQGSIAYKKGWIAQAVREFQTANRMDPTNSEYASALQRMNDGGYRQSRTGGVGGMNTCDCCANLICLDCCCECCGGDLISCC